MLSMQLKAWKPEVLNVDTVRMKMLNALAAEGRAHVKELKKTVTTWQGDKPKFNSIKNLNRQGAGMITTFPTGTELAVNKWYWLNSGTRVRYAVMSRGFESKTFPGWFGSGKGRGKKVFVSRKLNKGRGMPGIKARRWCELLAEDRQQPFGHAMQKAIGGPYFLAGFKAMR